MILLIETLIVSGCYSEITIFFQAICVKLILEGNEEIYISVLSQNEYVF